MPDSVESIIAGLRGDLAATALSLRQELEALSRIIVETRAQVTAVRPADSASAFIPSATDELAAIVQHTAAATHEIIDTCEVLEKLAEQVPEASGRLHEATTRIYEACAFQDITGQRIAKVVAALQAIEARISRTREAVEAPPEPATPSLLNGPQVPGAGVSQSDIDALFD